MSTPLNTKPNFHRVGPASDVRPRHAYKPGDDFIEQLTAAHRGLSDAASRVFNARLVLLLANHVGDLAVLQQALAAARQGLDTADAPTGDTS